MAFWPTALPSSPLLDGFSCQPAGYGLVVTEMDAGPPKVRRRTSTQGLLMQASWVLSRDQLNEFQSFFEIDLAHGSLTFTAEHPLPPYPLVAMRFDPRSTPSLRKVGQDVWRLDAQLVILSDEVLPSAFGADVARQGSGGGLAGPATLAAATTLRLRGSASASTAAVTASGSNTAIVRTGTAAVTLSAATAIASGSALPPSDSYQGGVYASDVHA